MYDKSFFLRLLLIFLELIIVLILFISLLTLQTLEKNESWMNVVYVPQSAGNYSIFSTMGQCNIYKWVLKSLSPNPQTLEGAVLDVCYTILPLMSGLYLRLTELSTQFITEKCMFSESGREGLFL